MKIKLSILCLFITALSLTILPIITGQYQLLIGSLPVTISGLIIVYVYKKCWYSKL